MNEKLKIGKKAQNFFSAYMNNLDNIMLQNLQDEIYSKDNFGVNYPVLISKKNLDKDVNLKRRYYKKFIHEEYFLTCEWIKSSMPKLDKFIDISNKIFNAPNALSQALEVTEIDLGQLIARTALFVSNETAEFLKENNKNREYTWYPNYRRKDVEIVKKGMGKDGIFYDDNTYANIGIKKALGYDKKEFHEYEVCHIWHKSCYDVRYHTSIVNLVLIPRAIAGLSDFDLDIINLLRYRAFDLYGWFPKSYKINGNNYTPKEPKKPNNYDSYQWLDTQPLTDKIKKSIKQRRIK